MSDKCYLTGATEKLMQVVVDGTTYYVSEEIGDSCSAKQLNEKIRTKKSEEGNKVSCILAQMDDMAKTMGVSKEDLIKILGGKLPGEIREVEAVVEKAEPKLTLVKVQPQPQQPKDDGFREVQGGLTSPIRARVNIDNSQGAISGSVPAFSSVRDNNSKVVIESDKKVKTVGEGNNKTLITKSNMGTTAIKVGGRKADEINKTISQLDHDHNLVRKSITGGPGSQGSECPVCRGTGFTQINQSTCIKCDGVGVIY